MAPITLKDIAVASGVSYATVSRAITQRGSVDPQTRARIIKVAKELGYRPNIRARSLKTNQTFTIALIVPDLSNPFFADIACAISENAFQCGFNTILCSSNWDAALEKAQLTMLNDQRVDGIIIKPVSDPPYPFKQFDTPFITICSDEDENYTHIEVANYQGGEIAANHFYHCRYRKPSFIGALNASKSNTDRLQGFLNVWQKHDISLPMEHIRMGSFSIESGYRETKALFQTDQYPDCVFCGNDLIALGALQYLTETQMNVPKEFGVIGFDDVEFASLPQIQMTTISQPRLEMGRLAVDCMIAAIDAYPNLTPQKYILIPTLAKRKSTRFFE